MLKLNNKIYLHKLFWNLYLKTYHVEVKLYGQNFSVTTTFYLKTYHVKVKDILVTVCMLLGCYLKTYHVKVKGLVL